MHHMQQNCTNSHQIAANILLFCICWQSRTSRACSFLTEFVLNKFYPTDQVVFNSPYNFITVLFQVNHLLADVGGVIALWLGLSFLSIMQFVELAYDLITAFIRRCLLSIQFHKKVHQQQNMYISEECTDDISDTERCDAQSESMGSFRDNKFGAKISRKTRLPKAKQLRIGTKQKRKHCQKCRESYWRTSTN